MNLSRCTSGQRDIITTLDAPLMVAAGAGSGKTFTLTQRIVSALAPGGADGAREPYLSSINEVLAITFTKKAAAELKSRIKAQLVAEGLVDQALGVDDAWISTIHGMASRILREHALELGLDPAFEVIGESEAEELLAQAVDAVARSIEHGDDALMTELLSAMKLFASVPGETGAVDLALQVLGRVQAMPAGFDGLVVAEPASTPGALLRELYELGLAFRETACAWPKVGATEQRHLDALEEALAGAEAWFARGDKAGFLEAAFDVRAYRRAFYAFPPTSPQFHAKKDDNCFFASYRSEYARLSDEVEACIACRSSRALVQLARLIDCEFSQIKGPSRLDNTDLLVQCARALNERPAVAERYRSQFKLIMVDEFQDTDKLQVSLVSALARPQLANVCTVGDAQQSIYRFRGADVNVFFEYRSQLRATNSNARFVELPDNFRSHADVLALVDAVFSQPQVFGREFLHLEPRSALNGTPDAVFEGRERISFDVIHYKRSTASSAGVSKTQAVELAARHIAGYFADLRARGARVGDMALLLGSMGNADMYARALRDAGIDSVIAGGSVFSGSAEAQLVLSALRYAVCSSDEPALFALLTSPLFALSDDVLLALSSRRDEDGVMKSRSLASGFVASADDDVCVAALCDNDRRALALARLQLAYFARRAQRGQVSEALRQLLSETGLLDRMEALGAQSTLSAGNFAKALYLVRGFERKETGVASVCHAYAEHLRTAKEAPGMLATVESDFVRIMTVHSSKGLEFPHVVVADLGTGVGSRVPLLAENLGDNTFAAMSSSTSGEFEKTLKSLRSFGREDDPVPEPSACATPGELYRALDEHTRRQTLAEAQRLFYVALTRASRSLMVSCVLGSHPQKAYEGAGIYQDLYTALKWDANASKSITMADYGGSAPARITFEYVTTPSEYAEALGACVVQPACEQTLEAPFTVRERERVPVPVFAPCSFGREDVRSYSSLDHAPLSFALLNGAAQLADEERVRLSDAGDDDATELGTAFHRVAERAVLAFVARRAAGGGTRIEHPGAAVLDTQAHRHNLTSDQADRLDHAAELWFSSSLARKLAACKHVAAEVPFMVRVETPDAEAFFLEGELDALGSNDDGHALLIDYKTGGFSFETDEFLFEKHLLQAQCYAYALLSSGFSSVEAHFTRVEQPSAENPQEPEAVVYRFDAADRAALAHVIARAKTSGN